MTTKRALTKLTISIASLLVVAGCKSPPSLDPFPNVYLYTPDLTAGVCAQYRLIDEVNITYQWVADLKLDQGSPCDHMRGFERHDFKAVQNWFRDAISAYIPYDQK